MQKQPPNPPPPNKGSSKLMSLKLKLNNRNCHTKAAFSRDVVRGPLTHPVGILP